MIDGLVKIQSVFESGEYIFSIVQIYINNSQ